jgi:hypothetical protein
MLNILSLGAGVQSSTMALMAAHGELPMPDCAIFADTQWEPKAIYKHLDWLEKQLPFPVHRVTAGSLRDGAISDKPTRGGDHLRFAAIPWFTDDGGMGRRQCTSDYKIVPLNKKCRELCGYKPRQRIPVGSVEMWIGISTDEASRMKPSRDRWIKSRWPLIEKDMSRQNCIKWFADRYPDRRLQKSSCLGCPFHNDAAWRELKMGDPEEWADTVYVDTKIRDGHTREGKRLMKAKQYMHRSLLPLDEVDFRNLEDKGQLNMFNNECEGMCGV